MPDNAPCRYVIKDTLLQASPPSPTYTATVTAQNTRRHRGPDTFPRQDDNQLKKKKKTILVTQGADDLLEDWKTVTQVS